MVVRKMPSNEGNNSNNDKAPDYNPVASQSNQRPDAEAEEYGPQHALINEPSMNVNTDINSSTSQPSLGIGKKEEKVEYAVSCSCCACIPVLQLNIPKVTLAFIEERNKSTNGSKKNGKENSNKVQSVSYNMPGRRKAPPKGPFPYAKRKFFKSGGLLERYEAQTAGRPNHQDDSDDDEDYHSASNYEKNDVGSDNDGDTSDSDEFTFSRRRESCNSMNKANCISSH